MSDISEKLISIYNSVQSIKSAIENKGVNVSNAVLSDYASKINEISCDNKFYKCKYVTEDFKTITLSNEGGYGTGTYTLEGNDAITTSSIFTNGEYSIRYLNFKWVLWNVNADTILCEFNSGSIPQDGSYASNQYLGNVTCNIVCNKFYLWSGYLWDKDTNIFSSSITSGLSCENDLVTGKVYQEDGKDVFLNKNIDLVQVTNYVAHKDSRTYVASVTISGIGIVVETDRSAANGTYYIVNVEANPKVYKHDTENYYLYFYNDGYDQYQNWYFCLYTSTGADPYSVILAISVETSSSIPNGSNTWKNYDYGQSHTVTSITSSVTQPEILQVLKGVKAIDYIPSSHTWTFDSTEYDFETFENTPIKHGVWSNTGTALFGNRIGWGSLPLQNLVFYCPLTENGNPEIGGTLSATTGTPTFTTYQGVKCTSFNGYSYFDIATISDWLSGNWTFTGWLASENTDLWKCSTLCVPNSVLTQRVWDNYMRSIGGNWSVTTDGAFVSNKWYFVYVQYDREKQKFYSGYRYIGGSLVTASTGGTATCVSSSVDFRIGCDYDSSQFYPWQGYITKVRLFNTKLDDNELDMLYNQLHPI